MNELDSVLKLTPPLLLALALTIVGRGVKEIPQIPNKFIPPILWVVGAVIYPLIADPTLLNTKVAHPAVYNALIGLICGSGAVGFNQGWRQILGGYGAPDQPVVLQPPIPPTK